MADNQNTKGAANARRDVPDGTPIRSTAQNGHLTNGAPNYDPTYVRRFLELLDHKSVGGVTEIRILPKSVRLEIKGRTEYVGKTVVGYYEPDQYEQAAHDMADFDGHAHIYVTINPVRTALLARACNRLQLCAKSTANDSDILCRSWMYLDADPIRPSGISSTNAQLEGALSLRDLMATELEFYGAQVIKGMSGNGGHVLIRLEDLRTNEATKALVELVLKDFAQRYSQSESDDDASVRINVDTTVGNASRICKCYGTLAVKGDDLPTNPHRRAVIEFPAAPPLPFDIGLIPIEEEQAPSPPLRYQIGANHRCDARESAYVQAVFRKAMSKVDMAPDGQKHGFVLRGAVNCAGFIHTGAITAQEIEDALFAAIESRAADKKQARKTIQDGIRYGQQKPSQIPPPDANFSNEKASSSRAVRKDEPTKNSREGPSEVPDAPFEFSTDADLDELLGAIEWLWNNYIPRGFLTGIVGEQDTGKSTVAQDFCRIVLTGGLWPDGTRCDIPCEKLLWIDTDGNLALFHKRLKEWEMPRGRFIFPPDALQELSMDNPANWKWIEQVIERFAPPLVVIDALSGSHSGKENDTDSMKERMKRLHALAQKHKIAVVVIHHLNKAPFGVTPYPLSIDRLRGSTSISQFCRSILALTTPDTTNPTERRLDVIKLNLAKKPPAVGYVLTDNGPAWGDAPEPFKEYRTPDAAADFLITALSEGPRGAKEVRDEAVAKGLSDYALKEARKQLGVNVSKSPVASGGWIWSLCTEKNMDA